MLKKLLAVCFGVLFVANFAFAENLKEAKFKTNAHCGDCKSKIEKAVSEVKGVKSATLDLKDKVALVKYDADQTTPAKLADAITKAGYKATEEKCSGTCKDSKKDKKCCDKQVEGNNCDPKKCTGHK